MKIIIKTMETPEEIEGKFSRSLANVERGL